MISFEDFCLRLTALQCGFMIPHLETMHNRGFRFLHARVKISETTYESILKGHHCDSLGGEHIIVFGEYENVLVIIEKKIIEPKTNTDWLIQAIRFFIPKYQDNTRTPAEALKEAKKADEDHCILVYEERTKTVRIYSRRAFGKDVSWTSLSI
ncbi:MAG: hypothetical protein WCJ59_01680 [bacterium]